MYIFDGNPIKISNRDTFFEIDPRWWFEMKANKNNNGYNQGEAETDEVQSKLGQIFNFSPFPQI